MMIEVRKRLRAEEEEKRREVTKEVEEALDVQTNCPFHRRSL